jgi:hypothetical protein
VIVNDFLSPADRYPEYINIPFETLSYIEISHPNQSGKISIKFTCFPFVSLFHIVILNTSCVFLFHAVVFTDFDTQSPGQTTLIVSVQIAVLP